MKKYSFILSFTLIFVAYSVLVVAVDLSKTTGLSGSLTSSYTSYSVNFGDNYSSIGSACFDFTFTGDIYDPGDSLQYSLVPAPAPYWYGFGSDTKSYSTLTSCLTPAHQTFNELLDGSITGSVWMKNGTVNIQSLVIRLINAVSSATTTTTTTTTVPNVTTTTTTIPNQTTTTTIPAPISKSMQITINLPKTTYYPNENLEPKITITDASGKLITDATIKGSITGPKTLSPYFFYSSLCDCYKALQWLDESILIGDYTLSVEISHPSFDKTTASTSFKIVKPTIQTFTITTDKQEYFPGDSIKVTVTVKDSLGNLIKDAYLTGEIRDADTGKLVSPIYPFISGDVYTYTYYLGSETLGKSYKISAGTTWKEQKAAADATINVGKRGLNADVVLEKNVLSPKDSLRGRIKVFDKDGNIVKDASVSAELKDPQGFVSTYLSATFKDSFYELDSWTVQDWTSVGTYTLEIKISKYPEETMITKTIEITKQKLNVEVLLDRTSYKPGDKMYIKILVAYPNGTVAKDAWVGGEIFSLLSEPLGEETEFYKPGLCRIYLAPITPVFYKGEYIQKYFLDSPYIPSDCANGKYVLKIKIGAPGYADAEVLKEFDIALAKFFIETGFSVNSHVDSVDLVIYAEIKDENGKEIEFANIEGNLRPAEELKGCIKQFSFYYDSLLKRYVVNQFVSRYECAEGNYIIQIKASSPSYETAEVVQGTTIQYKQGYEYRTYVPATPFEATCREVSCGPNCIQKVCQSEVVGENCYDIVTDDECVNTCTRELERVEESISQGGVVTVNLEACIEQCTVKVPCQGSSVPVVPLEVMVEKLNELRKEVAETKEEVSGLKQLLLTIIDFVNSILSKYLGQQQAITVPSEVVANATNTTNPITGALSSVIKTILRQ
ncbi:MAG: hypothetical protein HY361_03515 [Candidatus Aenigmarchaeota archaeon]|nr:hypothetical protein [Candidatus Aenigmarchaeota archaeon]